MKTTVMRGAFVALIAFFISPAPGQNIKRNLPSVTPGVYQQEIAQSYTVESGLPSNDVRSIAVMPDGTVYAGTASGLARFDGSAWATVPELAGAPVELLSRNKDNLYATHKGAFMRVAPGTPSRVAQLPGGANGAAPLAISTAAGSMLGTAEGLYILDDDEFAEIMGTGRNRSQILGARDIASGSDMTVVAAETGLFLFRGGEGWEQLIPQDEDRRWAPASVRGVTFDSTGQLWFASPNGVGRLNPRANEWKLYRGEDGLPYDDFTCIAAGENGVVWFGTTIGAIRFDGKTWEYRQSRRWLPHDEVRAIDVDANGNAWFATPGGVGRIDRVPMRLADKARLFEEEIDRYHRRTPYGFVDSVHLARPGDKSEFTQRDSDNDGLWTSMYGAGECFAYAATKSEDAKLRAKQAFQALRFLNEVTQGGSNPAPKGFPARTILPTSGPNPNEGRAKRDLEEKTFGDKLWKVIEPRWPTSADGQWYWKSDTSSDELDGHYFFYALYYDLVADEEEKQRVREVVTAITDHLIEHDFCLVDHDGQPTRWAVFGPKQINFDKNWFQERGLNSLSMLSYLRVAEHMTGDKKYAEAADMLINEHGYAQNVLVPKVQNGVGSGNQSDDEMAFMNFYNILKYEKNPELRQIWSLSFYRYWLLEEPEVNPLFNFMFAGVATGEVFRDYDGERKIEPHGDWLQASVDNLKRYPIDRIEWAMKNSHRKDIKPLSPHLWQVQGSRGMRVDGRALPIDERFVEHWNHDPFRLDLGGNGTTLADGASFLLPYYMGLYHGFIVE